MLRKRGAGAQSLPMIWPRGAKARIGMDCEAADRPDPHPIHAFRPHGLRAGFQNCARSVSWKLRGSP